MPKYFVNGPLVKFQKLEGEIAHHLTRVMRVRLGEEVILCDGVEMDYYYRVESLKPLILKLERSQGCKSELPYKIRLFQALPKSDKLEWIIQKTVELGVHSIVPVYTERSIKAQKLTAEKKVLAKQRDKIERYQKIAESAAGQSMRGIIPCLHPFVSWEDAMKMNRGFVLSADTSPGGRSLKSIFSEKTLGSTEEISLWVGPEGGFSEKEMVDMKDAGFTMFCMGPRILRTETAAMAAIAQIVGLLEDG